MPGPLSQDLRSRFTTLFNDGQSARSAARQLKLSASTGVRWAQKIRSTGTVECEHFGRPAGTGILDKHSAFFEELLHDNPDITLFELRNAFLEASGKRVHHSTVANLLKRLGFTYKKSHWLQASGPLRA